MALLLGSVTRAAVLALLAAQSDLTVYPDGAPDRATPPYVTVWLSTDLEDPDRFEGSSNRAWWRITTHAVGNSAEAALRVSGLVRAALLNKRPAAVASSSRIRHSAGQPPATDESTGQVVSMITDQWTFQSWSPTA